MAIRVGLGSGEGKRSKRTSASVPVPVPVPPKVIRNPKPPVSCIVASESGWKRDLQEIVREFQGMTYADAELVIVGDGSGWSSEIFDGDRRLHYLKVPGTVGLSEKLDVGIKFSTGEVLLRLNDDLVHAKGHIEEALKKDPPYWKLIPDEVTSSGPC
jgi:hypothetical protein